MNCSLAFVQVSEQLLEQVPAVEAEAAVGAPYSPEASRLREWLTDVLVVSHLPALPVPCLSSWGGGRAASRVSPCCCFLRSL